MKVNSTMNTKDILIDDKLGDEDENIIPEYSITSYGADYPVEVLVARLDAGSIFTPDFQRSYVWDYRTASRFIESLLLGLPVPGIFLSVEPDSQTHLIIDGQQRLKTLQRFYHGTFSNSTTSERIFKLTGVLSRFKDQTYKGLAVEDQRRLGNAIMHATIIRQDDPAEDQSSVYHIFERLNSGSKQLAPQEIRSALFHGRLVELLHELNHNPAWRAIYGVPSPNLRDQELILRFLAFFFYQDNYKSPMKAFLNRYMAHNRDLERQSAFDIREIFEPTIALVQEILGNRAFRLGRALNAAVFESVMVGLARRLRYGPIEDLAALRYQYDALLTNPAFLSGITKATANEQRVAERFSAANDSFAQLR